MKIWKNEKDGGGGRDGGDEKFEKKVKKWKNEKQNEKNGETWWKKKEKWKWKWKENEWKWEKMKKNEKLKKMKKMGGMGGMKKWKIWKKWKKWKNEKMNEKMEKHDEKRKKNEKIGFRRKILYDTGQLPKHCCRVRRHGLRFSSIHHAWDHATVFLCCASSRGRHSKCRCGSCSSAVVFLVLSNRQRSNCSCLGWGTSGNSRTARDLCARASGEMHLAPDPQFTSVLSLSSIVLGCGLSWVLEECQGQIVVLMSCGHPY